MMCSIVQIVLFLSLQEFLSKRCCNTERKLYYTNLLAFIPPLLHDIFVPITIALTSFYHTETIAY